MCSELTAHFPVFPLLPSHLMPWRNPLVGWPKCDRELASIVGIPSILLFLSWWPALFSPASKLRLAPLNHASLLAFSCGLVCRGCVPPWTLLTRISTPRRQKYFHDCFPGMSHVVDPGVFSTCLVDAALTTILGVFLVGRVRYFQL